MDIEKSLMEYDKKISIKGEELKNAYIIINQINRQLKEVSECTETLAKVMKAKDTLLKEMETRLKSNDTLFLKLTHEIKEILNNDITLDSNTPKHVLLEETLQKVNKY